MDWSAPSNDSRNHTSLHIMCAKEMSIMIHMIINALNCLHCSVPEMTASISQSSLNWVLHNVVCRIYSFKYNQQDTTLYNIVVNVLHVSGGFFAHRQELKNYTRSILYVPGLLAATASVVEFNSTCTVHHNIENIILFKV